ncbi:MAG: hypothetical protein M1594_01265 [Candidatus Marsarchaeota archaeon]|nr:hypothetical protein [Candidatus Marsarchaeota archaeon]
MLIAILGSIPYLIHILPNSFYNIYADIVFIILSSLSLVFFSKLNIKINSLKYLNYSLALLFISYLIRLAGDLGFINTSISAGIVMIAYLTLLVSMFYLFSEVFIPKKTMIASIITLLIILLITIFLQYQYYSSELIPLIQKIYFMTSSPA